MDESDGDGTGGVCADGGVGSWELAAGDIENIDFGSAAGANALHEGLREADYGHGAGWDDSRDGIVDWNRDHGAAAGNHVIGGYDAAHREWVIATCMHWVGKSASHVQGVLALPQVRCCGIYEALNGILIRCICCDAVRVDGGVDCDCVAAGNWFWIAGHNVVFIGCRQRATWAACGRRT